MPNSTNKSPKQQARLFMLCTHIGNVADIPPRALLAIKDADLLVFEEDRPAKLILKSANIHREYLKFSEHQQKETLQLIRQAMKNGQTITYMSDQGSPNIADPGGEILRIAYEFQAKITVVPGPSSITAALAAYPRPVQKFYYAGFLARDQKEREAELSGLKSQKCPVVLLDTPYRRQALLASCAKILGKDYQALLALDISGDEEDFYFGDLATVEKRAAEIGKLNFVLVVESKKK